MLLTESELALLQAIQPTLCRRMHERGKAEAHDCDGVTLVCSFCSVTAQQIAEAIQGGAKTQPAAD